MYLRPCLFAALCSATALLAAVHSAAAQECVGLPSGRGLLSVGFEGTDGATGHGASFAYQTRGAAVLLERRSLDDISLADNRITSGVQASVRIPTVALPLCVAAGAQWTAYDNSFHESTSVGPDPNYRLERHRIGGQYRARRVPLGVGVGREFRIGEQLALVPFLQPAIVYDRESLEPHNGPRETRSDWGWGISGGVTAAFDWLVLRSVVTHAATNEYALSSQHNWPVVSLHAGVRF